MKQSRFSTLASRLSALPFFHRSSKRTSWNGGNGSERSESPPNSDVQDSHLDQLHNADAACRHCFDQTSDRSQNVDPVPSDPTTEFVSSISLASSTSLSPVVQEFQQLIEGDSKLYMLFHQMFDQIPKRAPFDKDPTGKPQVRDYKTMLLSFNEILTQAPEWNQLVHNAGNVSFPFHSILTWPTATPAGMTAFADERVNNQFKKIFDVWSTFLSSHASCYVLTVDSWLSPGGLDAMPDFVRLFKCDPSAPHYGFKSWDDFFTRQLRDGVRPVAFPEDDNVINSACESSVYRIAHNVKALDTFWIKSQPYSINTMLNHDPLASQFVGGTVYQAFLGPTYYHRWHSPVNGRVVKTVLVPGLYYAQSPALGFVESEGLAAGNPSLSLNFNPDPNAPSRSQAFVTSTATRALMFIEADNPKIGLMCLMAVGMAEVSTCEITVKEGQKVRKGDQMGMFHFGGSTYCMLFRPSTKITLEQPLTITNTAVADDTNVDLKFSVQIDDYVHLNSAIATVL